MGEEENEIDLRDLTRIKKLPIWEVAAGAPAKPTDFSKPADGFGGRRQAIGGR